MEELARNVYLESDYPGVVLGAIAFKQGLVMVDAPFRPEDQYAWRSALAGLEAGSDRLLVMLDPHIDRTLGVKAMESIVLGHENSVEILHNRPTSARGQAIDAGADWEPFDLPLNIRWVLPEMTYSHTLSIYCDERPVRVTHHPGAHLAATWLQDDFAKVVFVGDSVVLHQPPFLAWADLALWQEDLALLESEVYKGYKIVSGRNGVVRTRSIAKLAEFLAEVKGIAAHAAEKQEPVEALLEEVPRLLKTLNFNKNLTQLYHNRLAWGLEQYYTQHFLKTKENSKGDH